MKKTLNREAVENLKRQYIETGLAFTHAHEKAWLEHRLEVGIDHRGMQIEFVLYGEFYKPDRIVDYPSIGVTILTADASEELNTNAVCALKGSVRLFEPGLPGIRNAFERLSVLTGCMTILQCGDCGIGWSSHYTAHGSTVQLARLDDAELTSAFEGLLSLPSATRQQVASALFWISHEPTLMRESHKNQLLKIYAGYWNAFECLVEAFLECKPMPKLSRSEKQSRIDAVVEAKGGKLAATDIEDLYRTLINVGLRGKARHVFTNFLPHDADRYMFECFESPIRMNRLYDIRNAINHGTIDFSDQDELMRIRPRLLQLKFIVLRMFGLLIPVRTPADTLYQNRHPTNPSEVTDDVA